MGNRTRKGIRYRVRFRSRLHAQRAVDPDDLAVDVAVQNDVLREVGVLVGETEAGGVGHSLGEEVLDLR